MGDRGRVDDLEDLLPAQYSNAHLDTWDRHLSIAFSSTKGLRNAPGENNCFVNCAVQVFWHLDVFRRSYRRLSGHTCMGNSCIFCALKVIFTQFQYSDKSSLHPDALRKALAETFANQQRFQLGHMDDAAECFENILRRLHFHVASNFNEDACTAAHCLPHQKFSMSVQEKVVCVCGASTSPLKFHEMVHYVSASALLAQSRMDQGKDGVTHTDRFGLLLRRASAMGDVRNCPANCGKQVQKQRTLLNVPDVVSVGLVWDSDRPSMETTTEVAKILGTSILLPDMYHHVVTDPKKLPLLQLVAVVCYYGKHYSTFVLHSKLKIWIYFDDATVREIGPMWSNVVDKCSRGRFQPLLLLYANDNAVPVSVDSAPQRRVMAAGYTPAGTSENGSSDGGRLDRTHENIKNLNLPSSRRSTTPTPTQTPNPHRSHPHTNTTPQLIAPLSPDDSGRDSPARMTGRDHVRQPSFLTAVSKDAARNKPGEASEGGRALPGGAAVAYKPSSRRQLLDGGANSGYLDPMVEEVGDYADYTLSSGDQYRRPSTLGVESKKPLPLPPNISRGAADDPRKAPASWKSCGKEKGGVDVVRYQADPGRVNSRGTPDFTTTKVYDQSVVLPSQKGGTAGPFRPASGHPGVERCASSASGREERGGGGSVWAGGQHVVVKPTPTPHTEPDCRSSAASSHTPVQSGLATLPRHHRGQNHHHHLRHHEPPATHHQGSSSSVLAHREVAQLTHRSGGSPRDCSSPLPPGTPPPEYESVVSGTVPTYPHQQSHGRQPSTSSQASTIRSSVSMGNLHQLGSSGKVPDNQLARNNVRNEKLSNAELPHQRCGDSSGKPAALMKKSDSDSEGLTGGKSSGGQPQQQQQYIDRRMVETILKHQGVHRHGSSCSNSSVESDSVMGKMGMKQSSTTTSALKVDIPLDTLSLSSLKDSGCGSSDRHSSSSTGSGSVDQFPQCFLTKSMIVPRSLNTAHNVVDQHSAAHFAKGHHHTTPDSNRSSPRSVQSSHSGTRAGSPQVTMHPIRESSQEDVLKPASPNEPIGTKKFIMAAPVDVPHSTEPRPPPIPPKNFAQFHIIRSSHSQLPTPHERMSSLENLIKEENVSSNFVSLCKKADVLMDKCVMAENKQDVSSALHSGEEALGCLKEAMTHKELNSKARAYLQRKHNNCLIKVHTLQKRAPASRQESHSSGIGSDVTSSVGNSRSSITSSDSDLSDQILRQQTSRQTAGPGRHTAGPPPLPRPRLPPPHPHTAPPSLPDRATRDTCGQGTVHGVTQGQNFDTKNSYRNSVGRTDNPDAYCSGVANNGGQRGGGGPSQIPPSRQVHGRTDSCSSSNGNSHAQQFHGRTDSTTSSVAPSSRVSDYVSANSINAGDDNNNTAEVYGTLPRNKSRKPGSGTGASAEMYQSFLNKQKSLQAEVRLSQQSLDSCRSDAGSVRSDAGSDAGGNKMNRTQIRQLLQDSIVQRQWHQPGSSGKSSPVQQQQQSAAVQQNSSAHDYRTYGQQPQPTPSSSLQQQQHSAYTQQPSPPSSSHPQSQQHRQQRRQPPPAGYHHHPAGGGLVPGPRAPPPGTMPAGRPRTPTCAPSANTGCANPANNAPSSHGGSGALGKSSLAQNVARVTPYSHLQDAQVMRPCSGNSYLVMMHGPSQQQNNPQSSAAARGGSQGHPPPASRPLERSASQSDCRSLGNGAHSTDHGSSLSNTVCKKPSSASLSLAKYNEHPQTAGSSRQQLSQGCASSPVSDESLTAEQTATTAPASVRSLLSRFERRGATAGGSNSRSPVKREPNHRTNLRRARSKSESTIPKSVLKKTRMKSRPRKSVTFAESIAHFADCDDANSGYESATEFGSSQPAASDSRLNCSDDELRLKEQRRFSDCDLYDSSGSSSGDDCNVAEEEVCHLCHRRRSSPGQAFCAKCSFYLSKLNLNLS